MTNDDFYAVWRVNMGTRSFHRQPVPPGWERLGGRALLARILVEDVNALCDPLGPYNKLVFAPGLLVGHMLSSCDRISIGGKSPLTGGVKEANAGGRTGLQLALLGVKALIIEGQPESSGWWSLHISADGVRFEEAGSLAGKGVFDAAPELMDQYGDKVAIALIGQGGEMLLRGAGIQNLDKDGVPSRIAARGGLGALMGSKGIKAIVVDGSQGEQPPLANAQAFQQARKDYTKALLAHPQTTTYHDYGTAAMTMMANAYGLLPTNNFSNGQFENAENLSGEHMRETMLSRGKSCDPSHACMAGCTIQSSNVFTTQDGETTVSPLEYETIGMMGSNLGLTDLDQVAKINYIVNDLGLDSIEIGAALGVAAEAGLMTFGDAERALALVQEIQAGTPLGRVLGSGAAVTGRVFGVRRVPVAKGQALSAYDPRALKGTGVTYATSPQGGDHTSGLTIRADIDHLKTEGQVELSRTSQFKMAGYDSLGACIFAGFGFASRLEVIPALLNARYGWDVDENILQELGRESIRWEREFNQLAGFTKADDRLPEWMSQEPLPPHNTVFDVPEEDLDNTFEW
jgi:aldehyde:ferredoxin oxidoreductase